MRRLEKMGWVAENVDKVHNDTTDSAQSRRQRGGSQATACRSRSLPAVATATGQHPEQGESGKFEI